MLRTEGASGQNSFQNSVRPEAKKEGQGPQAANVEGTATARGLAFQKKSSNWRRPNSS